MTPQGVVAELRRLFDASGAAGELEVHPGVHHGFAFPERKIYDVQAAERHWERLIALYTAEHQGWMIPGFIRQRRLNTCSASVPLPHPTRAGSRWLAARRTLREGDDYELDFIQGVLLLKSPVPSSGPPGTENFIAAGPIAFQRSPVPMQPSNGRSIGP